MKFCFAVSGKANEELGIQLPSILKIERLELWSFSEGPLLLGAFG
jgi:hypothetical protein